MLETKAILGIIASVIAVVSYLPYFRNILVGKTKPHLFTWLIWSITTAIILLAQIAKGAGAGSWALGATLVILFNIFLLSLWKGEKKFTRFDWFCLFAAFIAIGLWLLLRDPLLSVIVVTLIDAIGFFPTIAKSYHKPFDETLLTFLLSGVKFVLVLAALEAYSFTTVLYPAYLVVMNFSFVSMVVLRRRITSHQK